MTVTIQKWGNSQGIRIPQSILKEVNWSNNELIETFVRDDELILRKKTKNLTIEELFANYDEETTCQEFDWGDNKTKGKEIW